MTHSYYCDYCGDEIKTYEYENFIWGFSDNQGRHNPKQEIGGDVCKKCKQEIFTLIDDYTKRKRREK